jgi:thioredoxin reductase (NADPH)
MLHAASRERWQLDRAPLPLETSLPGVFAAGDVRYRSIKRVASAVGDGATAIRLVHEYLGSEETEALSVSLGR